jgi:enoyl-CoA hydratase
VTRRRVYCAAMPIHRTIEGTVDVLRLELPGGNALGHATIEALHEGLDAALRGPARAVVLTGTGKIFSTGLDIVDAYGYERPALERYVEAFDGLFRDLFSYPKPLVAAVNGHAIAGGCILALAADVRLMSDGPFGIGIPEVSLGIPFPAAAFEVSRAAVRASAETDAFLLGKRFSPAEAVAAGMIHEVVAPDLLVAAAIARATALASQPPAALRTVKAYLRQPVVERIAATWSARKDLFCDAWAAPEAREAIGKQRDALLRKRSTDAGPSPG